MNAVTEIGNATIAMIAKIERIDAKIQSLRLAGRDNRFAAGAAESIIFSLTRERNNIEENLILHSEAMIGMV